MNYQNLHSHTTTSDGKISYLETLKICRENQIEAVAFTDHDALPPKKEVNRLFRKRNHPVKWILGIEISSALPKELGGDPTENLHIVGLFINPFDRQLEIHCRKMQEARKKRMQLIVKNLKGLGFKITEKACLKESKGETINRPHIVAALTKNSANLKLIQKLKDQMEKESEKNPELRRKFLKMIKFGRQQYPYSLFLTGDSYIKGIYADYPYRLELDRTVKLIRNAGGVAFLAHWTFCKKKIDLKMLNNLLKQKRIDGLEIVYNAHTQGREKEILRDMKKVEKLTRKYQSLKSGGADSHSREEIRDFFKDTSLAQKTYRLAQEMIKQGNINTTWSSFS